MNRIDLHWKEGPEECHLAWVWISLILTAFTEHYFFGLIVLTLFLCTYHSLCGWFIKQAMNSSTVNHSNLQALVQDNSNLSVFSVLHVTQKYPLLQMVTSCRNGGSCAKPYTGNCQRQSSALQGALVWTGLPVPAFVFHMFYCDLVWFFPDIKAVLFW